MRILCTAFLAILVLAAGAPAGATAPPAGAAAPATVSAADRTQMVATLARTLEEKYVFPDRAIVAANAILAADRTGSYATSSDPEAFAGAVTQTLRGVLHDKHLRVRYSPEVIPAGADDHSTPADRFAQDRTFGMYENFGLFKAVRLRANVGYVDVRAFPTANLMAAALEATMTFLGNTDALIIDLRKNGGGDPAAVSLFCSYLFPAWQEVHVNDIFTRTPGTAGGETRQYWTVPVLGPRYLDKKIYVLTSARTFSGGEEFAYDLQTQKRATLIGETTGGGANPGDVVRLSDHFDAFVPSGRAINPITKTNWEGVGVKPDIATTADAALSTAYTLVLREKLAKATDPDDKKELGDMIDLFTKDPGSILNQ